MRLFALGVAICALSAAANAGTPDCKSISNTGRRLACYDKTTPPVATPATTKPASRADAKGNGAKYVDTIGAEDALMNARLKNICRGC
jgi:hypothetical protein